RDRTELANATALSNGTNNLTRVLGPSIRGVLTGIPFAGLSGVFFLIAASYGWAVFSILRIPVRGERVEAPRGTMFHEMTAGLRAIWREPSLRIFMTVGFIPL